MDEHYYGPEREYAIHNGIPCFLPDALSSESNIQKEHYDRHFQAYSKNLTYPHTMTYTKYLDSALKIRSPLEGMGDMAEICCGTGEGIWLLKDKFQRAVGVDISSHMLRIGKERMNDDNILFVQDDAFHLSLATGRSIQQSFWVEFIMYPIFKGCFQKLRVF